MRRSRRWPRNSTGTSRAGNCSSSGWMTMPSAGASRRADCSGSSEVSMPLVGLRPRLWSARPRRCSPAGPALRSATAPAMVLWGYWRQWETPFEVTLVGDRRPKGIRVHRVHHADVARHDQATRDSRHHPGDRRCWTCARAGTTSRSSARQQSPALAVADRGSPRRIRSRAIRTRPAANRVAKLLGLPAPRPGRAGRTTSRRSATSTGCRRRLWASRSSGTSPTRCSPPSA